MIQSNEKRVWNKMSWEKVEYSRNKIKTAGNAIAKNNYTKISNEEAQSILNNWRAAHAYPLQVLYVNCRRKASRKDAIAVQRLKRLDSIIGKLERQPEMNLLRMQDLGGCRMIMDNISDVYNVISDFKKSRIRHELLREYDYIQTPKKSGYRSVHLVYKYYSDKKSDYNGMLIEVQIRTKLQHLWATAIEVLGLYTKNNLKASQGDTRILRYMELVSALFAVEEKTKISENVPNSIKDILLELNELEDTKVLNILSAVKIAIDKKDKWTKGNKEGYYILSINHDDRKLKIEYFRKTDIINATEAYEEMEKKNRDNNIDSVLVSASSMEILKKAYPNYFSDVSAFIKQTYMLIEHLSKH